MKIIHLFFILFYSVYLSAQVTYSKTYDLSMGYNNLFKYFEFVEDELWVLSEHICITDSSYCMALSKYDSIGNLLEVDYIVNYVAGYGKTLLIENKDIIVGGINRGSHRILKTDENFQNDSLYIYESEDNYNCYGIIRHQGHYYTFGNVNHNHHLYGNILKWDTSFAVVDEWNYDYPYINKFMYGLQSTIDNHLVYLLEGKWPLEDSINFGMYIVKIDTSGHILDQFYVDDSIDGSILFAGKQGSYYFSSDKDLLHNNYFISTTINNLNAEMNQLLWSSGLPYKSITHPISYLNVYRSVTIADIQQANNGDLIVCGYVFDSDEELGIDKKHHGFLTRFSQDGEIIWNRLYKFPNTIDPETKGKYFTSYLFDVKTTNNGFMVGGKVYYGLENGRKKEDIWLISVDENGCLDNEECQEIITLDGINHYNQKSVYEIGTIWTYDYLIKDANQDIIHDYITYEITDTTQMQGSLVYIIENNKDLPMEYMYQDEEKIYFWDSYAQDFQLNYDFNAKYSYPTQITEICAPHQTYSFDLIINPKHKVTSVGGYHFQRKQLVTIPEGIGYSGSYEIIRLIGNRYGGMRLRFDEESCAKEYEIGVIRCFEQGDFSFVFHPHGFSPPCDTVWTEIIDAVEPSGHLQVNIYPNPISNELFIDLDGIDNVEVKIMDSYGRQIKQIKQLSSSTKINTGDWPVGIYFVMLSKSDKVILNSKIVLIR